MRLELQAKTGNQIAHMDNRNSRQKLLVIVGPTAVGKSKVAIFLAQELGGEIISADSMQVYKGMDIGTAKPLFEDRAKVRHHLVDVVEPSNDFSVAQYQKLARKKITEVAKRGVLPFLVGGSGLYVRSVIDELKFPKGKIRSDKRKQLEKIIETEGKGSLYDKLKKLDPKAASGIHPNNTRRVIRALEVITETEELFSEHRAKWKERKSIYDAEMVGLDMPRALLYANIDRRIDEMVANGLMEEVKNLVKQGFDEAITSKQALGYKELLDYLKERVGQEEAVKTIKTRTHQFAKRQLTWFKADSRIKWFDASKRSVSEIGSEAIDYLKQKNLLP